MTQFMAFLQQGGKAQKTQVNYKAQIPKLFNHGLSISDISDLDDDGIRAVVHTLNSKAQKDFVSAIHQFQAFLRDKQ